MTTFVGSFLLFQVQPMVARMALPDLGGAPAVWNSAMLVYQALLLAGYAWAHWLRRFPVRRQVLAHLACSWRACLWLPIGLASFEPPTGNSVVLFVPMLLLVSVGPVLLAVSAQAPLVQQWFAAGRGANPYPLYAASNLGSFTGLLAYPLLVEPLLRLDTQRWGWTAGYAVLFVLVGGCGVLTVPGAAPPRCTGRGAGPIARPCPPPARHVDRPVRGAVRADALDDDPPEHRHHGDAAAVGDPARALPAQLHRGLRGQPRAGPGDHPARPGAAPAVRRHPR